MIISRLSNMGVVGELGESVEWGRGGEPLKGLSAIALSICQRYYPKRHAVLTIFPPGRFLAENTRISEQVLKCCLLAV